MAIKFLNSVNADSGVLYVDADNNRVGIGTTSPKRQLHIHADTATTDARIQITDESTTQAVDKGIAIIKSNNQDGYFWNYSDAHLYFGTNAVQRMRIANNGKLLLNAYGSGTNTGTLAYALAVDSSGNVIESTIQANPAGIDGTGTADYLTKWLDGDTLTDSNVYEASGDLVTTLNLKSSSSYPQLKLTDTDNSTTSSIRSAGGSLQHVLHDATKSHVFYAGTTATELLRVTGDGKVGIGESNPTTKLHVYDATATAGVSIQGSNAHSSDINLGDTDDINIGRIKYDHTNDSMQFHTNNAERMRISSAGNLQLTAYTEGYLKSDASGNITVDTSIIEDTLDSVTDRDATTTNAITVGGLTVDTDTLHVDATNNRVGIGTTSPIAALHINNFNVPQLLLDGGGDSTGDIVVPSGEILQIGHWNTSLSSYTDRFRIAQNGDVGINTTSPDQKLHVTGNVRVTGAYYDSNNSPGLSGQILSSTATGTDWVSLSEIQGVDGTGTANYLAKWSDIDTITDSVVYDDGTNVGIGTSSPATKLHITGDVTGTNKLLIENTNNGTNSYAGLGFQSDFGHTYHPGILLNSSTNTAYGGVDSLNIWQYHSKPITLVTNNVVRAIVTGGGDVGIGTTAPNHKLEVAGNIGVDNYIYHNGDTNTYVKFDNDEITLYAGNHSVLNYAESTASTFDLGFGGQADTRIGAGNAAVIFQGGSEGSYDGKVGIGTTTPNVLFDVNKSTIGEYAYFGSGSTRQLRLSSYNTVSDHAGHKINASSGNGEITLATNSIAAVTVKNNQTLQFNAYTTGVLVTDANGNVSASTAYHTQETADARYVNVTGDTMTGGLNIEVSTSNTQLKLKRTTSATGEFNIYTNTDSLYFQNVGQSSYPMMINSAGSVGIGTTSPGTDAKLKVSGGGVDIESTTDSLRLRFYEGTSFKGGFQSVLNANEMISGSVAGDLAIRSQSNILFATGGNTRRMVITSDGDVGIGTASPSYKLHVAGDAGITGTLYSNDIEVDGGNQIVINNSSAGHITIGGMQNEAENGYLRGNITFSRDDDQVTYDTVNNVFVHAGGGSTDWSLIGHHSDGLRIYNGPSEATTWSKSYNTFKSDHMSMYINNTGAIQFGQYGAGYLKTDASGNITADNSVFLTEESDTLDSVTDRGATTANAITTGSITAQSSAYVRVRVDQTDSGLIDMGLSSGSVEGFLNVQNTGTNHLTNDPELKLLLNSTEYARLNATGFGIGTTDPTRKLHVNSGTTNHVAIFESTDATAWIQIKDNATASYISNTDNGLDIAADTNNEGANSNMRFLIDGSEHMRIDTSGNVGIGVTAPATLLTLSANLNNTVTFARDVDAIGMLVHGVGTAPGNIWLHRDDVTIDDGNALGNLKFSGADGGSYVGAAITAQASGAWSSTNSKARLIFETTSDGATSPSEKMRIEDDGTVQFTTYGAGYLKTDANGTITLDTVTSVVDGTGTASYIPKWSDSDTLTDSIIYDDGTSIGIGTTVPQGVLSVNKEDAMSSVVVSRGGTNLTASTAIGSLSFKADYADSPTDYANIYAYANAISGVRSSMDFNVKSSSGNILTAMTAYGSNTGTRIGIGTNAPAHKLTINTGTNYIYFDEDTNINQGTGSSDQPAIYADSVLRIRQRIELWDDNDGNNYLDIRDGSTQAIKLTPDGDSWITHDLGLGTTSPSGPLHIVKTSTESVIIENSDAGGNSDDLLIKNTNDRDVGIKLETGGGYYHIALDSNGDDSLVFHLADINAPNFEFYQNGDLQLHQYGAGTLKTDADGLVYADSSTTYVTSANGEGIYSFNDTVDASTSEDIFSISNQHGAQSFRVTFVCSTSNYSVAKTFEVVHAYGKTPVFFKVVDTGAWTYSSADHDFDVSFTNDATDDTKIVCSITNNSTTINADIVTTVFLGGSPTAITVTAL